MTKYYSNKPDFSSDTPWVFGLDATAKMRDYLKDIEELGKIVQEEEVDDLYVQRGEAALGVTKESGPFKTSYDRVNTMFTSAKKIHSDIMQNIDSKFTKGMDEAFLTLDKVNGHANPYKSKNIKKDVIKSRPKPGTNGYETETYTDQESYKLSELLDGKTSPIKAAKDVYDERLGVAKQILANKDKLSAEQRKVIEGKTAEEIVEIQYPTELPSYQRLKGSTFHEENKEWLQYVDLGLQVAAIAASIAGTVMTGGAGTPFLAASRTYAAVNSGYAWTTGKTLITGTQLTGEEQFWSGVEFFATLISGGGMIKLAKLGDGGTTLVRGIAKAATHADDFADAAQTIYAVGTSKNPEEAIFSYAGRQVFGFGIGKYADHLKMKRTNAELNARYQDYSSRKLNAGETPLTMPEWQQKVNILNQNKTVGAEFKAAQTEEFKQLAKHVENRITIATTIDGQIKKVQVDAIGFDSNGKIRIQDYTASGNISSKRQAILDNIEKNGGVIVGKGKGQFVGGVEIPKGTRIDVIKGGSQFSPEWQMYLNEFPKHGLTQSEINNIIKIKPDIERGIVRQDPQEYLPREYLEQHKKLFDDGVAAFVKDDFFIQKFGNFGREDGAFVFPKDVAKAMIKEADGNPRKLEALLGLDEGSLGDTPKMVLPQEVHNYRIPDGNEGGSRKNPQWRPGGKTYPGGVPEAVIDPVPKDKVTLVDVW